MDFSSLYCYEIEEDEENFFLELEEELEQLLNERARVRKELLELYNENDQLIDNYYDVMLESPDPPKLKSFELFSNELKKEKKKEKLGFSKKIGKKKVKMIAMHKKLLITSSSLPQVPSKRGRRKSGTACEEHRRLHAKCPLSCKGRILNQINQSNETCNKLQEEVLETKEETFSEEEKDISIYFSVD